MTNFDLAFDFMLPHEDYTLKGEVAKDNNGYDVRFGLNAKWHPELVQQGYYTETRDKALQIAKLTYNMFYWHPIQGTLINSQAVACKLFDQTVPMGVVRAVICIQTALVTEFGFKLDIDGHVGALTLQAMNAPEEIDLLDAFIKECTEFYNMLGRTHPQDAPLVPGWVNRVNQTWHPPQAPDTPVVVKFGS